MFFTGSDGCETIQSGEKLTIASLPAGIRIIGDRAFENCTAMRSAHFLGDAPETFGAAVFDGTAADFAVYYRRGAAGFTSPLWHGYPCVEESAPAIISEPVEIGRAHV